MIRTITAARCRAGLFALLAGVPFAAHSEESTQPSQELLEPVVVSARRLGSVRSDLLGSSVSVIDYAELENRQTRVVSDVLRDVPGVAVSRAGAVSGNTQVRMRGAEGNHTLVFVDGIKASDPYQGEFDFGTLFADDIAKIEVLRGEQSALYGSDAIGGVISYITASGAEAPGVRGYVEGGSFGTIAAAGRVAGVSGAVDYALNGGVFTTQGTPTARNGVRNVGSSNRTGAGKFTFTVSDDFRVKAVVRAASIDAKADPQDFAFPPGPTYGYVIDGNDSYKNTSLSGLLSGEFELADKRWKNSVTVQGVKVERNGYGGGGLGPDTVSSGDKGNRTKASYVSSYDFGDAMLAQTVTGALDYEREQYQNTDPFALADTTVRSSRNLGLVGLYDLVWNDRLGLGAAVRADRNYRFKDSTTYRVQATYRFDSGFRPRAAAGSGVKAPGIYELYAYSPGPNSYIGNPNLKPEKSQGWEAGFDQTFGRDFAVIGITYFHSDLKDEIFTDFVGVNFAASPANRTTDSTRRGVEFSATVRPVKPLRIDVAYTHLKAEEGGKQEVRRPRNVGSVNIDYRGADDRWGANLAVRYSGDQNDLNFTLTGPPVVVLPAYTLVNLGADVRLKGALRLYGRIENALDKKYEEVYTYRTAGRAAYVGLKGTF